MAVRKALVRVAGKLRQLPAGDTIEGLVRDDDARLTDAREWTASTVTQAEAEAGAATTRSAWTAQRVFQAIAAWWAASAMKTKLDGIATGATANATDAQLRDRSTHTGTQAISTVTDLQTALDGKINTTERGVSGGIPTLDEFARIPASQLPSYVDDVLEYLTTAEFPATGETGKIYIAINQGTAADPTRQYRWTGSVYAEINPSPGTTDALAEGSTNLYFNESRVRNTVLTGLSLASSAAVAATDNVLAAFGKIQARLNLLGTAANANVQTSATDTTAGAILTVGAFGWGNRPSVADANDAPLGVSMVNMGATANVPGGYSGAGWLQTDAQLSYTGTKVQHLTLSSNARMFVRTYTGSAWTAWQELWHTGNFDPSVKANLNSPTFTGDPKAPTPAAEDNDTSIATTAHVKAAISLAKQTSPTDTTAGALMPVGAFGLGSAMTIDSGSDLNAIVQPGTYAYIGGTAPLNIPMTGAGYLEVIGLSTYPHQRWKRIYQNRTFERSASKASPTTAAADWTPWVEVFHAGNFDPATKQDKSSIVTTATSRTLALTDAWNYLRPGTTSAITLTVPTNASVAFGIGTEITIRASGNITLAAATGVTLNAPSGGTLNMTARMTVTLKKVATDAWDVIGQTVAA